MPVYAEQSYNSKLALRFGFATAVHKVTLDEEVLYSAIQKILSNYSNFKDNAKRAHAFFLDRALDGMQMAEYGVRRALREGGRGRRWRMTKGMDLDWLSYVHLDVAASLLALALFLANA
uniref:glucuronosyltransferase n=1 Tax=Globodera rostochiensis TaxID=31243 RepID=A0A914HCJ4_GLORO